MKRIRHYLGLAKLSNTKYTVDGKTYEIYARRWNIEVFFKDQKKYLPLGQCQSQTLNAQIAAITICMIQYNLLATAKRFECYESFGALFKAAGVGASEATVTQRIWFVLNELITESPRFSIWMKKS